MKTITTGIITLIAFLSASPRSPAQWILPVENHTNIIFSRDSFRKFQAAQLKIWETASRSYDFRMITPVPEWASDEIRVFAIITGKTGEKKREFLQLQWDEDKETWLVAEHSFADADKDEVAKSYLIVKSWLSNLKASEKGGNCGLDSCPILWECRANPRERVYLQALAFSEPKEKSAKAQETTVLNCLFKGIYAEAKQPEE